MNKFCHTGFSQIQELYNQHVEQIDSALQHCKETPCTNGMAGEPIPYQLRNDFAVTGIVFLCFFLADHIFIQSCFDLMWCRNIFEIDHRLRSL